MPAREPLLQPRLVVPDPDRARIHRHGDILASLCRGLAGKRKLDIAVARDLGLFKWGDQALVPSNKLHFQRALREIRHLLTVTYLGQIINLEEPRVDGNLRVLASAPSNSGYIRERRMSEYSGPYEVSGTHGYVQRFKTDEYLHAELQSNHSRSIMWSTWRPCRDFLKIALDVVPADGDVEAYWLEDDEEHSANVHKLLGAAAMESWAPTAMTADLGGTAVFWRAKFKKFDTSRSSYSEVAINVPGAASLPRQQLRALIVATGSPLVQRFADLEPAALEAVLSEGRVLEESV